MLKFEGVMERSQRLAMASLWVSLGALLSACGGGGGAGSNGVPPPPPPPPPAPVVLTVDDKATASWGEGQAGVANIDVLANDTLPTGTATLSVVTAPAHGRVTVQGSQLQYTPDVGYLGADSLGYQVDVGGVRGTATLRITVQGTLALRGTVNGLAVPEVAVVAQVGDVSSAGTVSGSNFTVLVTSANPADLVTVTAAGTAGNAAQALRSIVGNMGTLAQTRADGYDTTAKAALDLHVLNTARYGLLRQRGALPADSASLRGALAKLNQVDVYETAMVLKQALATAAAMPAGVANTAELAGSVQALSALRGAWASSSTSRWLIETANTGPAQLARQLVASTPPVIGPQGARFVIHDPSADSFWTPRAVNTVLDLRPDGSATVFLNGVYDWTTTPHRIEAQWTRTDKSIDVTMSTRIYVFTSPSNPASMYWLTRIRLHAYRWGDSPESWLMMGLSGTLEHCSVIQQHCSYDGPFDFDEKPVRSFEVSRDRLPFRVEDFAAGSRWLGAEAVADQAGATCLCTPQALSFTGTPNVGGLSGELTSAGEWKLSGSGFNYRYTRLWQGEDGLEYWLGEVEQGGTVLNANVRAVAKAAAIETPSAADLSRRWLLLSEPERQDPSAYWLSSYDFLSTSMTDSGGDPSGLYFQIVGKTGDGYLALQLQSRGSQQPALIRLRDMGPAP